MNGNNKKSKIEEQQLSLEQRASLIQSLEQRFTRLTHILYDTDIEFSVLEKDVWPVLSNDIVFKDPWQVTNGIKKYRIGAKGFHASFYFNFDIFQLDVSLDENEPSKGRCMVDGVMNLNPLKFIGFSYPLRTILVYHFEILDGEEPHFLIREHEEMWSFACLIHNLPLGIGRCYNVFRWIFGILFSLYCWTMCTLLSRLGTRITK